MLAQELGGDGGVASSFPLVLESNEVKGVKVSGSRMRTCWIVCRSKRRSLRAPPRQLCEPVVCSCGTRSSGEDLLSVQNPIHVPASQRKKALTRQKRGETCEPGRDWGVIRASGHTELRHYGDVKCRLVGLKCDEWV